MNSINEKYIFEPTRFDYVNPKAEGVIVGITPGNSQMKGDRAGPKDSSYLWCLERAKEAREIIRKTN